MVTFMKSLKWATILSSILCILAVFFSCCTKKEPPLVVLTTGENAPFSMKNEKGELVGFDIELIRMIAGSMHRGVELKCLPFDELIDAIQTRKGDVAIGDISITEDRERLVDFSPAYHQSGFCLLMLDTTSGELKDLSNKMIGVRKGTWQEKAVKTSWADLPNLFVQSFDHLTIPDIVAKLRSGDLAACILDTDEAQYIVNNNKDLKIVALPAVGMLGIGVITCQGSIYSKPIREFIEKHPSEINALKVKWFSPAGGRQ